MCGALSPTLCLHTCGSYLGKAYKRTVGKNRLVGFTKVKQHTGGTNRIGAGPRQAGANGTCAQINMISYVEY